MELAELGVQLQREQNLFNRRVGEAKSIATQLNEVSAEVTHLSDTVQSLDEVMGILNNFADVRQSELQSKIETLITHGLKTIFGGDLTFHIKTGTKGKFSSMDFVVRSTSGGEVVETPVLEARGGGVAAVVGFLLRLILLLLKKDAEPVLFLDETFAQLSAEYEPALAEFIRELCDRTKVQVIMVTHSDAYSDVADVQYRFKLEDGVTKIQKGS